MSRILRLLLWAAAHPAIAALGAREFRLSLTTSYDFVEEVLAYDSGRELAHLLTLRRFEP